MIKKLKTLIFSMTFLICSAFSGHAILSEAIENELKVPPRSFAFYAVEKANVDAFLSRYPFLEALRNRIYSHVKGRAFDLHEYGVPNLDFTAALLLYSDRRDPKELGVLFDLFTKTPPEKRLPLWEDLNAFAEDRSKGAQLCEFYYDSDDNIDSSAYKVLETNTLKYKLLNLPHQ